MCFFRYITHVGIQHPEEDEDPWDNEHKSAYARVHDLVLELGGTLPVLFYEEFATRFLGKL